jgi:hypothetical protein
MSRDRYTLTVTRQEFGALAEALRYSQETALEGGGRFDPTLSRIQRKLGLAVGDE